MPTIKTERDILGTVCNACGGAGERWYTSTSTWRQGMGGASMTIGQCDTCWGSGDQERPWPDVLALESRARELDEEQVVEWIGRRSGAGMKSQHRLIGHLLERLQGETRRRKLPDGIDPFWYGLTVEAVMSSIRRVMDASGRLVEKEASHDDRKQ